MTSKKELRNLIASRRDSLTEIDLAQLSKGVEERLFGFEPFLAARTVMFFAAFRSEVHTVSMIARAMSERKRVLVPVSLLDTHELLPCMVTDINRDLVPGAYNIPEPPPERRIAVDPMDIDFLCMPGLGFDRQGNRLGYGGGYYDRFLERLRPDCTLAALAFAFQIVDAVPHAPHDKPVQFVVTNDEIIKCVKGE